MPPKKASCCSVCNLICKGEMLFKHQAHRRKFSLLEAVIGLYPKRNLSSLSDAPICTTCAGKLGSAWQSNLDFGEKIHEFSHLQQILTTTNVFASKSSQTETELPTPNSPRPIPKPIPGTTPVVQKMIKFRSKVKDRSVLYRSIAGILHEELKLLEAATVFKKEVKDPSDLIAQNKLIMTELVQHAPLLLVIFKRILKPLKESPKTPIKRKVSVKTKKNPLSPKKDGRTVKCSITEEDLLPQMRAILGVILNSRNQKLSAFQKSMALILFMGRASMKTFETFNKFKLCCSYKSTVRTLDNLVKDGYDNQVLKFKEYASLAFNQDGMEIDEEGGESNDEIEEEASWEDIPLYKARKRLKFAEEEDTAADSINANGMFLGASFSIDNIDTVIDNLHRSSKTGGRDIHMTSVLHIRNRIPQPMSEIKEPSKFAKCSDVPVSDYLPSMPEIKAVKDHHISLLTRLLVKHLPLFQSLQNHPKIEWGLKHRNNKQSSKKSKVINLGIENINSGTKDGMIQVLNLLKRWWAKINNTERYAPILVSGDGLTVNLMRKTIDSRFNSVHEEDKFIGAETAPGFFHLRFVLTQDVMDEFVVCDVGEPGDGSLPHLASLFNHDSKMTKVKSHFHLATRFLNFGLAANVCALALSFLDGQVTDFDDTRPDWNDDKKYEILQQVVLQISEFVWMDMARNVGEKEFCFCNGASPEEPMIMCQNSFCRNPSWFHITCLNGENNVEFCTPPENLENDYYCSKSCKQEATDGKSTYVRSFVNSWLHNAGFREAIRYNDGDLMSAYNKFQFVELFNSGQSHAQYKKIMHLLLAQKAGLSPPSIVHDLKYNSTVNMSGKVNGNIEKDLFHEFVNRALKDTVLLHYGSCNAEAVIRRSKSHHILMEVARSLGDEIGLEEHEAYNSKKEAWSVDVKKAVSIILEENVTKVIGRRSFSGFKKFKPSLFVLEDINEFKSSIAASSKKYDNVIENRDCPRQRLGKCKK